MEPADECWHIDSFLGGYGFAASYLRKCNELEYEHREPAIKIDAQVYTKLVQLDCKNGGSLSDQLHWCLEYTTQSDIIKVYFFIEFTLQSRSSLSTLHRIAITEAGYNLDGSLRDRVSHRNPISIA